MLEKVVEANAVPVPFGTCALVVSVSVGGSIYPRDATDELALRECADLRMYEAKRSGGGRYRL